MIYVIFLCRDISHNKLTVIGKKTLRGSMLLKNLQMDNNEIICIDDAVIRGLKDMEILTLNANNITTLGKDLFENMPKLRVLRIADNKLLCDCLLRWLSKFLNENSRLALFTKCASPLQVRGRNIVELEDSDFKCNGVDENMPPASCSLEPMCPYLCTCSDGIVDCRDKGITKIPDNIPEGTTELRLEQNQIQEVPLKAFAPYKRLRRIDLSNNQIQSVAADAFQGLKSLSSLVLYGNKILDLPAGIFHGLTSLQLLLLNANKISCIRKDTFADLHNLNLLSLYDNNIRSLTNGTFDNLKSIQTLHLARNPFICDCNLKWLADYLHKNPIETSGARCENPKRVQRRRIGQMKDKKFKCGEEYRTKLAGQCLIDEDCPEECVCEGTIIDCSGRQLKEIPENIPTFATELRLNNNEIDKIKNNGLFQRLTNLKKLDLRSNLINTIEDGAFVGAASINDLLLSENHLKKLTAKMFAGLTGLKTLMLRTNKIECVTNDTFVDLVNVRLLSLYENLIRCIQPGAFDRLQHLTTLNLLSNPFTCNCHLGWLSDWLRKKSMVGGSPRCNLPQRLKDIPIHDIPATDFKCDDENRENACSHEPHCPHRCACTGSIVRCSRAKLKEIPKEIPEATTELYLDVNEISSIQPERISHLKSLTRLDISNNQIFMLVNNTFSNLTNLSTLILSYNKLQCVQRDGFFGLKSLRILSLHGNDISLIPDGAFRDLGAITHVALGSNPFFCDCHLRWLSDWVKKDYVEPGIARCAEPMSMRDKLVLTTPSKNFECKVGKIPSEILAKCDACYTFPCRNGATCRSLTNRKYECVCTPGFHGENCEYIVDACYGNPCENGGTCKVMEEGRFSCHCPVGFVGDRCETNVDDCLGHKCKNNGTCKDLIQGYECHCQPGYTGYYCEKKIQFCSKEFNPCKNGGICNNHLSHYSCTCPEGFQGQNCTVNVDDCKDHLCQHGGTCVDGVNGYTCRCPEEYAGMFCEIAPMVAMLYPQTSPCQDHDCKNGHCFQPTGSSDYVCKCAPGFSGKRCEYLTSFSFRDPSAYLELEPLRTIPESNITVTFATTQQNGIIIYNGHQLQHVAIELFNGRIRVSYDVGNYPVSTMFSFEQVADGHFHTAQLLMHKKNFTMKVDAGVSRSIINEGLKEFLELKTPMYVGGVPGDGGALAIKLWHLKNTTSFNGCFKELYINDKMFDFVTAQKQHKVTPGCSNYETVTTDPCLENMCKKGKCVPVESNMHYECQCKLGWGGPFCDQAPTCQKQQWRDYYEENGCRSRKKIKKANCVGSCGSNCCQPRKTKKRKIRLICNDGTSYMKDIEVIRKCTCVKKC
ncbi:hypothetical protein CHUAL_010127 [Chamberlinius hualienensis]